jgi:hypothetical protein
MQKNPRAKNDSAISLTQLSLPDDPCHFYHFNSEWINLETLHRSFGPKCGKRNFELCGKYAYHFTHDDEGDSVWLDHTFFKITNDYQLEITQGKISKKIKLLSQAPESPHDNPWCVLKLLRNEAVVITDDDDSLYIISGYDSGGNILYTTTVNSKTITHPEKNENYYHEYLGCIGITKQEIIFSTGPFSDAKASEVVNLYSGKKTKYDFQLAGYFSDENQDSLAGFMEDDDSLMVITILGSGKKIVEQKQHWDVYESVLFGDLLFYSSFCPISTGASLNCINIKTGKMQWIASVLQMNVAHSIYSNNVILSLYKDKIIMEGDEAYGNYLQVFDINSGKRLAAFGAVLRRPQR